MMRSLLAAPAVAALLLAGTAGIAAAQERSCETVKSALLDAETAAKLPLTVDGVTYPDLGAVTTALGALPDIPAVEPLRTRLEAVVDAAADVELLKSELTTCTETTPTPESSTTPAPEPTDPPASASVDVPAPEVSQSPTDRPDTTTDDGAVADSVPSGGVDTGGW